MKTIVMTGGTAGFGAVAAGKLAQTPNTRVILGARSHTQLEALPLDLTSLESVRQFVKTLNTKLGDTRIDALVLNAGTQFADLDHRTADGFETTFGVNHLAHYLLVRLLLPKLSAGATVVITTSDTHDSKQNPMGPKQLNPELLAHPPAQRRRTGFLDGFRAYSASKLCNLLTARALAASGEAKSLNLTVVAFNPGLTPGTSLFRGWPLWARLLMGLATLMRPLARLSTVEQAGQALADLAIGRAKPPAGRIYASLVRRKLTWPDPSELAQRNDVMDALWRDSTRMVGLAN